MGVRPRLVVLALLALLVLGQQVLSHGLLTDLDRVVEDWLVPRRDNALTDLARTVTWLGAPTLVVPVLALLTLAAAVRHRSWTEPLRVAVLLLALAVTVLVLKDVVARPAAHGGTTHGGAWPSGHTATATVVWGCAVRLLRPAPRLARVLDVGVPALVAVCLLLAGYHVVTDVLAGFALGTLLLQLLGPRGSAQDARAAPSTRAPAATSGRGGR